MECICKVIYAAKVAAWDLIRTLEEFGGGVRRASAEGVEFCSKRELVAKTKIGDFNVHVGVQQKVLSLKDKTKLISIAHKMHKLEKKLSRHNGYSKKI